MCGLLSTFALLCFATSSGAELAYAEQAGEVLKIPLTYDPLTCPLPIAYAKVNGSSLALPFIIDFGTPNPVILDNWAATKLGIDLRSRSAQANPQDKSVQIKLDSIEFVPSVNSRAASFVSLPATVGDLHLSADDFPGPRIAGIVGWYTFSTVPVRLDFSLKRMDVYAGGARPPASSNPAIPITRSELTFTVPISGRKLSAPVDAILDTGAVYTSLPQKYLSDFEVVSTSGDRVKTYTVAGSVEASPSFVRSLSIGGQNVDAVTTMASKRFERALLGMEVLRRFTVTVDLANNKLWLENPTKIVGIPGREDVVLKRVRDGLQVDWIRENSPAARAGVLRGDLVLKCDGLAVGGLSLASTQSLIAGFSGSVATLNVRRKQFDVTVEFNRVPLAGPPK